MSRQRFRIGRLAGWLILGAFLLATLFPIYWALRSALSTNNGLITDPASLTPVEFTTFNFERVVSDVPAEEARAVGGNDQDFALFTAIRNSVIVATVITVGQVFFCAMAAYAFARLKFKGREVLFIIMLSALMVPPIFSLIPNFLLLRDMELDLWLFTIPLDWLPFVDDKRGWINTHAGLIAPFFLMTPFAIFFLRQFFIGISREVEEAAVLDGAGHVRRFFQIVLPMAAAPLATLAIITYVNSWNEFLWPFVAGRDESVRTLTVALNDFKAQTPGNTRPDWTGLMSATFVSSLPIVVLFAVLGRRVVDSIQFSGIK